MNVLKTFEIRNWIGNEFWTISLILEQKIYPKCLLYWKQYGCYDLARFSWVLSNLLWLIT